MLAPGIKAVGFDMDGTIMNTVVDYSKLSRVSEDTFRDLGVPDEAIEEDRKRVSIYNCTDWLVKNGKADVVPRLEQMIGDRATSVEMEHTELAKPYDGLLELLALLKKKGYKVGVLTRGGREYAETILGKFDLLKEFDALVARDDYPTGEAKPNPIAMQHFAEKMGVKTEEIVFVGDGDVDRLTAVRAGTPFIGVHTGSLDRAGWEELGGKDIVTVDSVKDIIKMIE